MFSRRLKKCLGINVYCILSRNRNHPYVHQYPSPCHICLQHHRGQDPQRIGDLRVEVDIVETANEEVLYCAIGKSMLLKGAHDPEQDHFWTLCGRATL